MTMQGFANKRDYLRLMRSHARGIDEWNRVATDYWLYPNIGTPTSQTGFVMTSLDMTAGSGADSMGAAAKVAGGAGTTSIPTANQQPSGDAGIPNHILTNASGDLLLSPPLFGSDVEGFMARRMLNKRTIPRFLKLESFATFSVASANEPRSVFGFYVSCTDATLANNHYAAWGSDGTNFRMRSVAQTNFVNALTGPAVDNAVHFWEIIIDFLHLTAEGKVDGVSYGTLDISVAGLQDVFPLCFGFHVLTTNRLKMGLTHIFYDY